MARKEMERESEGTKNESDTLLNQARDECVCEYNRSQISHLVARNWLRCRSDEIGP